MRECDLRGHGDDEIWEYASGNGFTLVSKDSDFEQRSLLYGHPPKVIWLRIGNCTREQLVQILTGYEEEIAAFGANSTEAILVLH